MILPAKYLGLSSEPGPRMVVEALKLYGTLERPGIGDNSTIIAWADEVSKESPSAYTTWAAGFYEHDSIAWCGLFMAVVACRAGKALPPKYLSALAWLEFGTKVAAPKLGDVLVFKRNGGGHVALYVGEDDTHYHILGGNQGDAVTIIRKAKFDCIGARRPSYNVTPANVRVIRYATVLGESDHAQLS